VDERKRRIGENEVLFREVNERVEALNEAFNAVSDRVSIVCECDDTACVEHVSVRPDEYEAIRSDPTLFAVLPGHESPAVENVETRHGSFLVVRKKPGEPAKIAVATDPRSN
jgi:hypothetical protein